MPSIDLLPAAQVDYDMSFDWYLERSARSAQKFAAAIDAAVGRIASAPDQFPFIDDRHRECLVKGFPFRLIYRVEETRVLIVAVAHAKRNPSYWHER